jgi:hypothetical protein
MRDVPRKALRGKLVEQDHQRERALRSGLPLREFTARGGLVIPQEALAKTRVELLVLGEPQRGTRFTPERDDSLCALDRVAGLQETSRREVRCGIHRFLRHAR